MVGYFLTLWCHEHFRKNRKELGKSLPQSFLQFVLLDMPAGHPHLFWCGYIYCSSLDRVQNSIARVLFAHNWVVWVIDDYIQLTKNSKTFSASTMQKTARFLRPVRLGRFSILAHFARGATLCIGFGRCSLIPCHDSQNQLFPGRAKSNRTSRKKVSGKRQWSSRPT